MFQNLYTRVFVHWKPTLLGLLGAGLTGLADYIVNGQITAKGAALAFGIAAIGALKKQAETAAGTAAQNDLSK